MSSSKYNKYYNTSQRNDTMFDHIPYNFYINQPQALCFIVLGAAGMAGLQNLFFSMYLVLYFRKSFDILKVNKHKPQMHPLSDPIYNYANSRCTLYTIIKYVNTPFVHFRLGLDEFDACFIFTVHVSLLFPCWSRMWVLGNGSKYCWSCLFGNVLFPLLT